MMHIASKKKVRKVEHPKKGMIVLEIFALCLFILFIMPFVLVIFNSAKTAKEIIENPVALPSNWGTMLTNIRAIFTNPTTDYVGAFIDSTIITTVSLVVITLCSTMCAWVLVRNKTKWSTFIFMMFVSAMVIPFQVVMYPLVRWLRMVGEFLGIQILGTYSGIVFAYLGFGCSMTIFICHGFIKNIPLELEEAGTIDGCGRAGIFFRIVFPLLQPVIVTVLILNGIWIWNDYLLPLLILSSSGNVQTIPLAVTAFAGSYVKQWDLILTSTLLAMLPVIILFIFAQKYIIKGMVDGSIK